MRHCKHPKRRLPSLYVLYKKKAMYTKMVASWLVSCVEINKDVDCCDHNLGENKNDDDPLEQFTLAP